MDPELASLLNRTVDDSSINAVLVYHYLPTETDLAQLQSLGFVGGTRFRTLPMVIISGTKEQIAAASHLPGIRAMYTNRTLSFNTEPEVRNATGVERTRGDADLIGRNFGLQPTGRNVTVAVLDTGIDGTHGDISGRVTKNIKLADSQSASGGFNYPVNSENFTGMEHLSPESLLEVAAFLVGSSLEWRLVPSSSDLAPEMRRCFTCWADSTTC